MPRIRNVKPEFLTHEHLQSLEVSNPGQYIMLTFEGLWIISDRNGVFLYRPKIMHLSILPFIEYDFEKTLDILESNGYFVRYTVDGHEYGRIPTFKIHQAISGKELKGKFIYPEPDNNVQNAPGTGAERVQNAPGTGAERVQNAPGTGAERVQNAPGTGAERVQNAPGTGADSLDFMTSLHHDFMTSDIMITREEKREAEEPISPEPINEPESIPDQDPTPEPPKLSDRELIVALGNELTNEWYKERFKQTGVTLQPSSEDRVAAINAVGRIGTNRNLVLGTIKVYWENWNNQYFSVKQGDMKRPIHLRKPEYKFRSFLGNIESCLPQAPTAPPQDDPESQKRDADRLELMRRFGFAGGSTMAKIEQEERDAEQQNDP